MENKIKQYQREFLAKGESGTMALALAQTRQLTEEFSKLHSEIKSIKNLLLSNYSEEALKKMNSDE